MSVEIERAGADDLPQFAEMEQEPETRSFIVSYTLEEHRRSFADPEIIYLRILDDREIVGFFILALDPDGRSVEFRRIVVACRGKGIGQHAIARMEAFCRDSLARTRIWLDVFEDNALARHVYEKGGYVRFGEVAGEDCRLLLYEKRMDSRGDSSG